MAVLDWLRQQLGEDEAPPAPGDSLVRQDASGQFQPYMPPSTGDALQRLYDTLGISDLSAAKDAASRGEYLPALGQGAAGAAALASNVLPFGAAAKGAMRGVRPLTGMLEDVLADTSGALRVPRRRLPPLGRDAEPLPDLPTAPPSMGSNRPPDAPYPQYALEYPATQPGKLTLDKKKGTEYLAKDLTPEAQQFAKDRLKIIADMRQNGYTPYYDVSQRYDADPSYYPRNADTRDIIPVKQTTIDQHMAKIGSDEARERLRLAYQRGSEMEKTDKWYAMGQLEQDFIKELGPVEGRKAFADRFATSMAATTGGQSPEDNLLMAAYGNYLRTHGLPYPTAAHEMPVLIGGQFATGNITQHRKIFDEGGFSGLGVGNANPKRANFAQNFVGNPGPATMDEQMVSRMTPGKTVPDDNNYGIYERVLGEEAKNVGVDPRDYQDVAWAGAKNFKDPKYATGVPMIETFNEAIERTHRLTGMPRDEIVRGFIHGKIPMYGLLGAAGLGAASQGGEQ